MCHCAQCAPSGSADTQELRTGRSGRTAFTHLIVKSSTRTRGKRGESRSNTGQSLVSCLCLASISFKIHMSSSVSFLETARKDGSSEASSACDFGDFGRFFLFFVTLVYSLSDGSSASSPQRLRVLSVTGANAEKSRILVSNVRTAKACLNSKKHYSCHYSPTWIPYAAVDSYSSDTPPSP